jgi:hypothetical protein
VKEQEERLLTALVWMCVQYLEEDGSLNHMHMSAGEQAMKLLAEYGLIDGPQRGAVWTEHGRAFLAAH